MSAARPITLAGLRGFVAVAQCGSFTRAADLMHLTQSALSRQVLSLEEEVGCALLLRSTRKVSLTAAGEELLRSAIASLADIDDCVARLRGPEPRRRVAVSTFASFASLWLIPRLGRFSAAHPDVDVNCLAADRVVLLDAEGIDLALRCTSARLLPPDGELLFEEILVPVCSPAYLESAPRLRTLADLKHHPWLRLEEAIEAITPTTAWEHVLERNGLAGLRGRSEFRFTNNDQVVQAALAGQGVALAHAPLAIDQLDAGQLVPLFDYPYPTQYAYYLVSTERSRQREHVRAFAAWVLTEAAQTRERLARLGERGGGSKKAR
jgi:LysR family glycine cleavage system transcriptional activator